MSAETVAGAETDKRVAAPDAGAAPGSGPPPAEAPAGARSRRRLVVGGLTAVVVLPLLVALAALHSPRWYPLLDLAMTELRVRDVGTRHTPLIGLVGRLSSNGNQGSHPGPISFWALAPTYRLLGGQAWSLFVGTVVLNTIAVGLTLWVAVRRGGAALALGMAAALAVLVHLYGTQVLTEPWNPYLPVMWWPLTLLALWAVLCDDLPMLPVAVLAGSFCMQTHISYVGLVGGFAAVAAVGLAVRARKLRGDPPALRRLLGWSAIAGVVGLVLWLPPIIDQAVGDPGNASIVVDHFRSPDEPAIGVERGVDVFAVSLSPWRFVTGSEGISGSVLPGLMLAAAWLVAAVVAWRHIRPDGREVRDLRRLHAVVGVALVLGLISATRILGFLWFYLVLWAWSITMLAIVAIVWTAVLVARPHVRRTHRPLAGRLAWGALAAVLVAWTALFAVDATDAEPSDHRESVMVGQLTESVAAAIDAGEVTGGGRDGRYLLTWFDGVHIGAPGYGMLADLERRGFDVGVLESYGPGARDHRVMPVADATAEIHISLGSDIAVWDAKPDAVRLAHIDPRTDAERLAYDEARDEAIDAIRRAGRDELVPLVDTASFMLYFDDRLPEPALEPLALMNELGLPAAVYVGPVSLAP